MPNKALPETYDQVKQRLDEIVTEVANEDLSLDDALDLYEEAIKLGMRASDLVEEDAFGSADGGSDQDAQPVAD